MQVLVASGYYDLATPYRAVEHSLAGLGLDPVLRKNITTETYDAGHMMYLHMPVAAQAEARRRGLDRPGAEEVIQWRRSGPPFPQESSTMPSPFPGMDPYLEAADIWPDFHHASPWRAQRELNRILPAAHYAEIESARSWGSIEERQVIGTTVSRLPWSAALRAET